MRKIIVFVLISLVFLSSCKKVKKEHFANGELERIFQYKGEQYDGFYKEYHKNGQLAVEAQYCNGKLEGEKRVYYESGNLYWVGVFKNDKEQGVFKEYYDNGNLKAKMNFEEGKQTGTGMYYYENGELESIVEYVNNNPTGKALYYYPDGSLKMEALTDCGKTLYYKEYDTSGMLLEEWRSVLIEPQKDDTISLSEHYKVKISLMGPIPKDSVVFNVLIYNNENMKHYSGWHTIIGQKNKAIYTYEPDSAGIYLMKVHAAVGTKKDYKMFYGGRYFMVE